MINEWLESLSILIQSNAWLAPFMALLAGIITSVTPCALSSIPLIIGYVGGTSHSDPQKAFRLSLVFALGMAATFTVLGLLASLAGNLIGTSASWWYLVLGGLMVLMALQIWGIFEFIPSTYLLSQNRSKGYLGALLTGILGGVFSSPCATPVLIVLLAIVAKQGNILGGILLLLLYSLGHSILVLVAGTSMGWVKKITSNPDYGKMSQIIKIIMGIVIIILGFYMFYLGF